MWQYLDMNAKQQGNLPAFSTFKENDPIFKFSEWQIRKYADKLKDILCLIIGCTREDLEDATFKETGLGPRWSCWAVFDKKDDKIYRVHNTQSEADQIIQYDNSKYIKRIELTPRLIMQHLGTNGGRELVHPNIWVNSLFTEYHPDVRWLITDVRFPNELSAVELVDSVTIRVNRPPEKITRISDGAVYLHQGQGMYANKQSLDMGSITRYPFSSFQSHHFDLHQDTHESETALDSYSKWSYVIENSGNMEDLFQKVRKIYTETV